MAQALTQINCPNCQSPTQATIEQLIDVNQDAAAKSRFLSGNLNRVQCPVCGFEGQIATPLVYHDPEHELLLTYTPVELSIPKDEQERVIGQLINQVINNLAPEDRKGYLFQPQTVLTAQSLVDRILEADGVSREEIEGQRERMRLFEDLLRIPEDHLLPFIEEHDDELDVAFFQLATLTLESTQDPKAREIVSQRISAALEMSSYGQDLLSQEAELRAAAESLKEIGDEISRERLLDLFIDAPTEKRVVALVNITRPALDYTFFQLLTEQIEAAEDEAKQSLLTLREQILETTQQIDKVQEARTAQAASLLKALLEAEDLEQALQSALPMVDDLFLTLLQANLNSVRESGNQEAIEKLETIQNRIEEIVRASMPPGLQFAQEIVQIEDEEQIIARLNESPEKIDDQFLNAIMSTTERLKDANNEEQVERMHRIYRAALRVSMQAKMKPGSD
jgi:hypothetical protein